MPPITADPRDEGVFYLCADHLWRYSRSGSSSWSMLQMTPSFTYGGGAYASALAISTADPSYWYVVNDAGTLWFSHTGGATFYQSLSTGPSAHYFYGTALVVSPTDPTEAYVGGSGYSGPAVYRTTDGGLNWDPVGEGLPPTLVYGLAFDDDTDPILYAATEAGPYRYDSGLGEWESILGTEAPLTTYWCVEGVPGIGVVRFGTYGRGIWDFEGGPIVAVDETAGAVPARRDRLSLFPNPARDAARFAFELAGAGPVRLEVFDVTGRRLAVPVDETRAAGAYELSFDLRTDDGRPLESGFYLVRLATAAGARVEKLRVVR
jgi:hypothetical protein